MLAANEQRFWRIYHEYLDRPDGDYAELLRRGEVTWQEGVDPEAWRAAIRRKARQDKISVGTSRSGERAFGFVNRRIPRDREQEVMAREFQRAEVLRGLRNRAALLGHEIVGWVRHDVESISVCRHCDERLYTRTDSQQIDDGEALTRPCPDHPPRDLSGLP